MLYALVNFYVLEPFFIVFNVCRCRHLVILQGTEVVVVVLLLDVVVVMVVIMGGDMAMLEGVEGGACITIIHRGGPDYARSVIDIDK